MSIEAIKYRDINALRLSFNNYEVIILNGRGCNVIEFKETSHNLSFLHFPEDNELDEFQKSPQRFGNAVLFPPNKLTHSRFSKNGITYDFEKHNIPGSHGIIKELPFELIESAECDNCIFVKFKLISADTPYYKAFSWNFNLYFEFTLSDEGLIQNIIFENTGSVVIPFGLGFHTAFRIPFNDHNLPNNYKIFVSCGKRWETDNYNNPSGRLVALVHDYSDQGVLPLAQPIAEHTTAISTNIPSSATIHTDFHGAIILDTTTGTEFIFETDTKFKNWMIWNNKASDNYICIEPMTWIIDAPNIPISDLESGFQFINPGQVWEAKNRLYVRI